MRAPLAVLVCLLVPALAVGEAIYRSTDEDGNALFTDEPPNDDAKPVELDPLTTVPADETPIDLGEASADAAADDPGPQGYAGVQVTYPPADQTVRHNGGMVPFRVALQPDGKQLEEGHSVEIMVDGETRGSGSSLQVSVSPVHRGEHTVRALVVDADGSALAASEPVRFHLLRASVNN